MESELPDQVEMPGQEEIPTEQVSTSTAFGAPTGRDPEERVAELEEVPQSEEKASVAEATVFPGAGIRELKEENPDKSVEEIVQEREPVATETEAWPPRGEIIR
jgi:hypothetical protein